ncbi:acyltransferase [Rhodococcus sp. IEGM 1401]|uniref:acyltransferase family protein n=1 Tax=unclassified Rhodococcus (in: high G+C Gram-positive bacteria) TaxID=192944 RepID=UPI0022B3235F|nr:MULTISPECIES: acyltransferase [unclassified Rhodococcus (in: high G+C Gram-positive bacteria)]MCZ4560887.1 acyltransferase [Rhodococcus sp. IEGM 1401]MDI9921028.1 acyltransferase [Rhodococcus sp. IEGM 1372]MDV8033372.1 acyltransferase [Rhodococcus sp. IEGM 1414]
MTAEIEPRASKPTRALWMDVLRGAAIFAVIVHHAVEALTWFDQPAPQILWQFNNILSPFRMPLLIFLSGMLLGKSLQKPLRRFASGKLRRIAWPYVVWSLITVGMVGQLAPGPLVRIAVQPELYTWYLWCLLVFYAVAFMLKKAPFWALALSCVVALGLATTGFNVRPFYLWPFFIIGYWAALNPGIWRAIGRNRYALPLLVLITIGTSVASFLGIEIRFHPAYAVLVLCAICMATASGFTVGDGPVARMFVYVGSNSLIFYCIHYPAIIVAVLVVNAVDLRSAWVTFPIYVLAGSVAGFAATWIVHRWPRTRVAFELPPHSSAKKVSTSWWERLPRISRRGSRRKASGPRHALSRAGGSTR